MTETMTTVDLAQAMVDTDDTFVLLDPTGYNLGQVTKVRFLDYPDAEIHTEDTIMALDAFVPVEVVRTRA